MGKEIELKLIVHHKDVVSFLNLPLLEQFAPGGYKTKKLFSQYYDTQDYGLWRCQAALRVRYDGTCYVQTLKRKGKSHQGLTERKEWEWLVKSIEPDTALVPGEHWPAAVRNRISTLRPVFVTDFERLVWNLALPAGSFFESQPPALVEMVLDRGMIVAIGAGQPQTEPILEVELELKKGVPEVLLQLSKIITTALPAHPSDISKAERGYRLLKGVRENL